MGGRRLPEVDTRRLAVSVGTGLGSAEELVFAYDGMRQRGLRRLAARGADVHAQRCGSHHRSGARRQSRCLHVDFGMRVGSEAIANAWRNIVYGEADMAICGGVETKIGPCRSPASPRCASCCPGNNDDPAGACPFDRTETDSCSAGQALMVIETEEHAKAAGANILARIMGASVTSDGYHMVAPDPDGVQASQAITRAVQLAGLQPSDIDHINAHATGTPRSATSPERRHQPGDGRHPGGLRAQVGARPSVGAVGAVESILTVMALRDGVIPDAQSAQSRPRGRPRCGGRRAPLRNITSTR